LAIILVVAALNAATVLLIFVIAKRPQFALLQALGQPPADLVTTVRLMALYIAGIGVGLGCALGMVLGWVQYSFELIRIPAESYMLDVLPMALYASDGLLVVTGALGLVLLVTQMPIRVLQKQRVVDALQWR
jgi:lipoprotein-releasing system permease protein